MTIDTYGKSIELKELLLEKLNYYKAIYIRKSNKK
jgi:hypothetical protein